MVKDNKIGNRGSYSGNKTIQKLKNCKIQRFKAITALSNRTKC